MRKRGKNPWKPEQIRKVNLMWRLGQTDKEIAAAVNHPVGSVTALRHERGWIGRPGRNQFRIERNGGREAEEAQIAAAVAAGKVRRFEGGQLWTLVTEILERHGHRVGMPDGYAHKVSLDGRKKHPREAIAIADKYRLKEGLPPLRMPRERERQAA